MTEETFAYEDEEGEGIDGIKSNIIEKGRYEFEVLDIENKTSNSGNDCVRITFKLNNGRIWTPLNMPTKIHPGKRLWNNFLFSIGLRGRGKKLEFTRSQIIGKKGLIDIGVKKNDLSGNNENKITDFAPIGTNDAPIKDVPEEGEQETKGDLGDDI